MSGGRVTDERLAELIGWRTPRIVLHAPGMCESCDLLYALRELQSLRAKVAELEAEVALRAAGEQP